MKVYLAGPLFTEAEIEFNRRLTAGLRHEMPEVDFALPQEFCNGIIDTRLVMEKCRDELKSSNVVVVTCDGPDVDSGTAFEAGMAYAWEIPILAYRTDFRRAGDCELDMNLMIGYAGEVVKPTQNQCLEIALSRALFRTQRLLKL